MSGNHTINDNLTDNVENIANIIIKQNKRVEFLTLCLELDNSDNYHKASSIVINTIGDDWKLTFDFSMLVVGKTREYMRMIAIKLI